MVSTCQPLLARKHFAEPPAPFLADLRGSASRSYINKVWRLMLPIYTALSFGATNSWFRRRASASLLVCVEICRFGRRKAFWDSAEHLGTNTAQPKITWVHKIKTEETSYQAKDPSMYSAKLPSTTVEAALQRTNRAFKLQTQFMSEDKIHVGKGQIYSVS